MDEQCSLICFIMWTEGRRRKQKRYSLNTSFYSENIVCFGLPLADFRTGSCLFAFSLTFLSCGCDAEKISGARAERRRAPSPCVQRRCSCRWKGSDEEERRSSQQNLTAGRQATIPPLSVSSDSYCTKRSFQGDFLLWFCFFFLPKAKAS